MASAKSLVASLICPVESFNLNSLCLHKHNYQFQYLKNLLKLLKLANKNHRERIFFQSVYYISYLYIYNILYQKVK